MRSVRINAGLLVGALIASITLTACESKEGEQDRATKDCEALLIAQEPGSITQGQRRIIDSERYIKIKRSYQRASAGGDRQHRREYFCDWRIEAGEVTYLMTQGQEGGDNGDQVIRLPQRQWDAAVKRHEANRSETTIR